MRAFYGAYGHAENSVEVTTNQRTEYSPIGQVFSVTKSINVTGQLRATTQVGMTAAINGLLNAYAIHNQRWVLKDDDGVETPHVLEPSGAKFGVRVVQPPSFTQGAEVYALARTFSIGLEATYESDNAPEIVSYNESITVKGQGGPLIVGVELLSGLAEIQTPRQNTLVYVSQTGQRVGRSFPPNYNFPQSLGSLQSNAIQITRGSPTLNENGSYENFPVSWSYEFIRNTGLLSFAPSYTP